MNLPIIAIEQLLEAGIHFGHNTKRWNPKMEQYIFGIRNKIHIIDLRITLPLINNALTKLFDVVSKSGKVLIVGTKKQSSTIVENIAKETQQYYVNKRWLGGTLTNWKTISNSIKKLDDIELILSDKNTNTNFFKFSDIVACAAPIGLFLGRIANFINGELFGKASTLPWSVIFPNGGNIPRHPSQIYEAILEGIFLFLLINFLAFKKGLIFKNGYISGLFLIFYSIARMIGENFREPDMHLGYFFNYFSMGSILSWITLLSGFLIIFLIKSNEQNN